MGKGSNSGSTEENGKSVGKQMPPMRNGGGKCRSPTFVLYKGSRPMGSFVHIVWCQLGAPRFS